MREIVQRILHISDLHIGDIDPITRQSTSDPKALKRPKIWQRFHGVLGHEDRTVGAVADLWHAFPNDGKNSLIVSGDITAFGAVAHFNNAREFIDRGLPDLSGLNLIGLKQNGSRQGIVPGNHDYFAGYPHPPGRTTGHMTAFFGPLPHANWSLPLPDNRILQFVHIDCDADFSAMSGHRFFARESGEKHLQAMSGLPQGTTHVRAVIMHGSPCYTNGRLKWYEVVSGAAVELRNFCASHNVVALLTGHMHRVKCWPHFRALPHDTHELRCGTSMQVLYRSNWSAAMNSSMPMKTQWALTHEIFREDGEMKWETTSWYLPISTNQFQSLRSRAFTF